MTSLRSLLHWLSPEKRQADHATATLRANAEKALRLKREAGSNRHIPEHQTAHEGMQPAEDSLVVHASRGAEGGFTPQLKRSRVPRSGDAG